MATDNSAPVWSFDRLRPNNRSRNSQVEKFFRSDTVGNRPRAVIREGIQNSLDAAVEDCVNVRIALGETTTGAIAEFVPGLRRHVDEIARLPQPPDWEAPVRYLVFEDFNTKGLEGDPRQWQPNDEVTNPFFNFFRGEGVSDKAEDARGRHGVGKMVFTTASRARCIFGVTATADRGPMLMGTSTLDMHHIGSEHYHPDGWFGRVESLADGDLVVPVTDDDLLERFSETFGVTRDTLPGLSIVVPWVVEPIDEDDDVPFTEATILRAVVEDWFWPILRGQLVVEVVAPSGEITMVSAATIRDLIENAPQDFGAGIRPLLDLAIWAHDLGTETALVLNAPDPLMAQAVHNVSGPLVADEDRPSLKATLENGGRVALRFPMAVRREPKEPLHSEFHVFLERDPNCAEGLLRFIREGLIVTDVRHRRASGYRGLVVVDEGPLGRFLGDAENPAHTEWQKEYVKSKYKCAPSCIEYVVQSVPNLLRALADGENEADPMLLVDLFYLPEPKPTGPKAKRPKVKKGEGESGTPEFGEIVAKPKRYRLLKRTDGFALRTGEPGADRPDLLDVKLAYGVRKGSPFKRYRPADFRVDKKPIAIDTTGCRIVHREGNHVRLAVDDDDFTFEITGFDTNRDLHVDVRAKDRDDEDQEDRQPDERDQHDAETAELHGATKDQPG